MQITGESITHNQHSEHAYIFIHSHSRFKCISAFLLKKNKLMWKEIEGTSGSFNKKKYILLPFSQLELIIWVCVLDIQVFIMFDQQE